MAEAEIVFAFDARIDRPVCPVDMPSDHRKRFASAGMAALEAVFAHAAARRAQAVVLFGDLFDPSRTSPAQAADVAEQIETFTAAGGMVVATAADADAAAMLATALGEPPGFQVLTPHATVTLTHGELAVDLQCDDPRDVQIAAHERAPVADTSPVDDDSDHTSAASGGPRAASAPPGSLVTRGVVRGQRDRPRVSLAEDALRTTWTLPSLQPRNRYEHGPGTAASLKLSAEGRVSHWNVFPTAAVSWQVVRTVCSADEQEEELSATAAAEVEQVVAACETPFCVVRLVIDCEGDADRRCRVSRMAPSVLAEMRQLLETPPADPARSVAWCEQVEADPEESLAAVAEADEIGSSRRFPAMLAAEAASWPLASAGDERIDPSAVVREAAWMTLELLEDD